MLYILLAVLCSTCVSQILKIIDIRRMPVSSVFLINYIVAAGTAAIRADFHTLPSVISAPGLYLTALFLGVMFIGSFYIYKKAIKELGISLSSTISRLSAGLPLLGSILFFREVPVTRQIAGMVLMFIAIPLASDKSADGRHKGLSFWGGLLFLAFGINDFTLKVSRELWPGVSEGAFLFFVFLTSSLCALALLLKKGESYAMGTLLPGIALGVVNLGSSFFILLALAVLPAIIVYPVLALGIIIMGLLTGMLFWKERLTLPHGLFLAIAIAAVLLIS